MTSFSRSGSTAFVALAISTSLVWACRGGKKEPPTTSVVAAIEDASTDIPTTDDDGGSSDGGGSMIPTAPSLKVAFIADTGTGSDFRSVLRLIKRERADVVLVQGDLNYSFFRSASAWFKIIDGELNPAKIPYLVAKGNHDTDWNAGYAPGLRTRMATAGIASEKSGSSPVDINYSVVFKGLKLVFVGDEETSPVTRADFVKARLENDRHLWKICAWHKNQRASNVGPKTDEMGWAIYEHCRAAGAIVAQGHSHTYSRSKTLTSTTTQTVDSTCSSAFDLCVGAGRHFFFDSSLGGYDTRVLNAEVAAKPYWATTYSGSFGALFLEINIDGDPKKARGYFKTTNNIIIDPPTTSGRKTFTVTRD